MSGPKSRQQRPVSKPKNLGKTLVRLFSFMSEYKLHFIAVAFCVILSSAASVIATYMLKPIINSCIEPFIGSPAPNRTPLIKMLLFIAAVYVIGIISSYIYNRIWVKISTSTLYNIRNKMFKRMQTFELSYFDERTNGEIMSRFTNDTDAVRQLFSQIPLSSILTFVGIFIAMLILSPILTLAAVLMLIVILFVIKFIGGKSAAEFRNQQKNLGALNGFVEEMIQGQKVVKVFGRERETTEQFAEVNEKLRSSAEKANTYANLLMPAMGNLSYVSYTLIACLGGFLVVRGLADVGTVGSFLVFIRSFYQPIIEISQQTSSLLSALSGAERIFELIDNPSEEDSGDIRLVNAVKDENGEIQEVPQHTGMWAWKIPADDGGFFYKELRGDVRFENVTFGYSDDKVVLNDISLYAKPGQKIAFVGSTGAGKTTITNLINRFYDIKQGQILYDGIDIKKIRKHDLRRSLGMVLQDTHLFTGTVMDNIRYGNLDATDEQVINAAKLANADSFIRKLPNGYQTMLTGDGANLSQGQRQLLSIARAAVADPSVLILDEATSSIDSRTESLIEKGMDKLMQGRTVFVIAHRLSTVKNANAIMVLEHGQILERGDHDVLLAAKGRYYNLYTGMFELD